MGQFKLLKMIIVVAEIKGRVICPYTIEKQLQRLLKESLYLSPQAISVGVGRESWITPTFPGVAVEGLKVASYLTR